MVVNVIWQRNEICNNESNYKINDPYEKLKSLHDLSKINLWKPVHETMPNFSKMDFPKHLKALKEIPMDHLIQELNSLDTVTADESSIPNWVYVLVALSICVGIVLLLYLWKKYFKNFEGIKSAIKRSNIHNLVTNVAKSDPSQDNSGGPEPLAVTSPSAPMLTSEDEVPLRVYPTIGLLSN